MGRKRKPINPSLYWRRADLAITQRLNEPFVTKQLSAQDLAEVNDAMIAAGFPKNKLRPRALILSALANAKDYRQTPHKPYTWKKLTRTSFGATRARGNQHNAALRFFLIAALFLAWRIAFGKEPRINRKIVKKDLHTIKTPFVVFAAQILAIVNIRKVEDNLNWYRIYERAVHAGKSPLMPLFMNPYTRQKG